MRQLLVLSTLFIALTPIFAQTTSAGDCGDPARHCVTDASCVNDRCSCDAGFTGDGYIGCSPEDCVICSLANDPILKNVRNERIDLPVPCRYHAMQYTATYKPTSPASEVGTTWTFDTLVSGFNERLHGKIYVSGFDVFVKYRTDDVSGEFRVRVKGGYSEGKYQFERAILLPEHVVWGPMETDDVELEAFPFNERFVTASIDHDDERVHVIIPFIYFQADYRPADPNYGLDQIYVPGLAMAVVTTDPDKVSWSGFSDAAMCLAPEGIGLGATESAQALSLSEENAFMYLSFANTDNQTFPGGSTECEKVANVVIDCNDVDFRKEAFDACSFILQSPHFVSCWEYSGAGVDSDILLELFKVCLDAFCRRDVGKCESISSQIEEHVCKKYANPLLVEHSCDF